MQEDFGEVKLWQIAMNKANGQGRSDDRFSVASFTIFIASFTISIGRENLANCVLFAKIFPLQYYPRMAWFTIDT